MREQLTEYQLRKIEREFERDMLDGEEMERISPMVLKAFAEIRSRRAADLTAFERMVLRSHRDRLNANELEDRALVAALDKLLAAAEGK